jgi:hypothetical protein
MFFWRIEALKTQLRRGSLPQPAAFGYLLAILLLYTAGTVAPITTLAWSPSALDRSVYVALILFVGGGTYAAYRANGGRQGSDFVARYVAISWVLGNRLAVMLLLPIMAVLFVLAMVFPDGEPSSQILETSGMAFALGFEALFYWRLVHHVRQVGTSL